MNLSQLFSSVNVWLLFAATVLLSIFSYEGGFQLGKYRAGRSEKAKDSPVGSIAGPTLGLLAFMLAFTFGMAASHFDARKQTVLQEAHAISSTYRMASMLPEPHREKVRDLLKEYVDIRLEGAKMRSFQELKNILARSEEIQHLLWSEAMVSETSGSGTSSSWLFLQSLDFMINVHADRVAVASKARIPATIWLVLYLIVIFSMSAAGYHVGLSGSRGSFVFLNLAITFSLVLILIADLDRPMQGLFKVSQQSMVDLQREMNTNVF